MKKLPIVIAVLIIAFAAIAIVILNKDSQQKPTETAEKEKVMMEKSHEGQAMEGENKMMDKMEGSKYVEYSKSALDKTASTKRVLYFYANWCETCRPTDKNFKENSDKIPQDVTLIRVNYNDSDTNQDEKDLAEKYGITYQHTFVQIDEKGNQVTKWNGGQIEELLANIK